MPKTIRNKYDECLTFSKLLEAHERARKGKANKRDVLKFSVDLETNITNILTCLKNENYKTGKYYNFTIYEPKERLIKALPYKDRVVQQWYIKEFIKPYIIPRFIKDTYACIDTRGTHSAVNSVQNYMRKMYRNYKEYYILKCDIKKFFYNIDKEILFNIMKKYISDLKLLNLTKIFIYDDGGEKGIPIGNYTSQFFANIYLNELDKHVKETLRIKYYVRYMDDFIILLKTKAECKEIKNKIEEFISLYLRLSLNSKSRYYPNKMGVNFCGYRIFETHRLVRTRCKQKMNKQIKKWNKLYEEGRLNTQRMLLSWNSFKAHTSHANTYKLKTTLFDKIEAKEILSKN